MHIEVEQKYRVSDHADVLSRLLEMGVTVSAEIEQRDTYYAHPARNYAKTDEALRIRRVDDRSYVTYKGPKLDATTKTRREIELPTDSPDEFDQLFMALGFTAVAEVVKRRRVVRVPGERFSVEVALDKIKGLGDYVELEVGTDQVDLAAARTQIAQLAVKLGLTDSERLSYLELLFAAEAEP